MKTGVAGRDNAWSSVFGIEGKFLVRIGDADRPRDQVQVVAPGGNFPGPNVVPGLPVNEWVHIAIVYDNTTKERIYYKDGVPVYKDEAASGNVSLSSGCYIGRAWMILVGCREIFQKSACGQCKERQSKLPLILMK